MKILTLLLAIPLATSAIAGPFGGYRPSFRPSFRPPSAPRPSYTPKPSTPKPNVISPAKQTPAAKPAPAVSKPASTPTPKPAAAPSGNRGTTLGPVKALGATANDTSRADPIWGRNAFGSMHGGSSFGYHPYLWLLWQNQTPRPPLAYAPQHATAQVGSQASEKKAELRAFDPEAEPDLTPKAEASGEVRRESGASWTKGREEQSSSSAGETMMLAGLIGAAVFLVLMWFLVRGKAS